MSDLEDEYNPRAHNSLLQAISSLKKTQHIRQSTRNEPKTTQDEFELVKGTNVAEDLREPTAGAVAVNDLVNLLNKKNKHLDARKLLRNVQRTKKVLRKPLEKPTAERIKRQIGYEKVKAKLQRWDAVVTQNRASETQVFPLQAETVYINTNLNSKPLQHSIKSQLRLKMEAAEEKLRQLKREREGDVENEEADEKRQRDLHRIKLTREELIARRKELAYLKMRESQQSAKARMRNKIKSKKYHKLLSRQKLQEQLKEFENLQKSDPEAALEKLKELEKSHARERATLRHKNTGTWAKNLKVRAKYDRDARKDLAEQLQISRELTQKNKVSDSEESDNDTPMIKADPDEKAEIYHDTSNPWMATSRKTTETSNFNAQEKDENWRQYWIERNRNENLLKEYKNELNDEVAKGQQRVEKEEEQENIDFKKETQSESLKKVNKAKKTKTKLKKRSAQYENGWLVEEISPEKTPAPLPDIDDIFDEVEDEIEIRVKEKLNRLSEEAKRLSNPYEKAEQGKRMERDELKHLKDLSFMEKSKHAILDEELGEEENRDKKQDSIIPSKTAIDNKTKIKDVSDDTNSMQGDIDPTSILTVTLKKPPINISTAAANFDEIGDAGAEFENGSFNEHHLTISEAFEDDDIVADFSQEKTKDSEIKNAEIELTMPGWGSWAGPGIDESKTRKMNKRIVLKLAPEEKRRDENKEAVYINEEASKQLRPHLVTDLPFPFTTLQDYEASIRAPIGRNFVPETAFRMLTRPAVITRKGAIIEPMDENELSKKPQKRPRSEVDKRILKRAARTVEAVK